jgi:hypothetical protein
MWNLGSEIGVPLTGAALDRHFTSIYGTGQVHTRTHRHTQIDTQTDTDRHTDRHR